MTRLFHVVAFLLVAGCGMPDNSANEVDIAPSVVNTIDNSEALDLKRAISNAQMWDDPMQRAISWADIVRHEPTYGDSLESSLEILRNQLLDKKTWFSARDLQLLRSSVGSRATSIVESSYRNLSDSLARSGIRYTDRSVFLHENWVSPELQTIGLSEEDYTFRCDYGNGHTKMVHEIATYPLWYTSISPDEAVGWELLSLDLQSHENRCGDFTCLADKCGPDAYELYDAYRDFDNKTAQVYARIIAEWHLFSLDGEGELAELWRLRAGIDNQQWVNILEERFKLTRREDEEVALRIARLILEYPSYL